MNIKLSKKTPKSRGSYLLSYEDNIDNAELVTIDDDGDGNLLLFSSHYKFGIQTIDDFINSKSSNDGALWSEKLNFIMEK